MMKKPSKKSAPPTETNPSAPSNMPMIAESGDAPAKKRSIAAVAAVAAIICGATGAGAWFVAPNFLGGQHRATTAGKAEKDTPSDHGVETKGDHGVDKKIDSKKSKKAKKEIDAHASAEVDIASGASSFSRRGDVGVFLPRPIVVSLSPQSRVRYLKVTLAIETTPDGEAAFMDNELRIIDALGSYLRAVPVDAIEDPSSMARIREQIARRVRFVVDPAPVHAVLITDFILS